VQSVATCGLLLDQLAEAGRRPLADLATADLIDVLAARAQSAAYFMSQRTLGLGLLDRVLTAKRLRVLAMVDGVALQ
jgi:hypothetical protein